MCGTGTTMATDGILVEWLRWVLLVLSGSLDRPGRHALQPRCGQPVAPAADPTGRRRRRARAARAGPSCRGSRARCRRSRSPTRSKPGNVRALVVTGGNPLAAFPEPDRLRAALRRLDVLVVVDVAESELTELATHVLPATGQLERADLTLAELTAVRSGLQATDGGRAAVGERRPVWWMLGALARRLGRRPARRRGLRTTSPTSCSSAACSPGHPRRRRACSPRGPHGVDVAGGVRLGARDDAARRPLADRPARAARRGSPRTASPAAGLVLAPRREMAWSNSVRYRARGRAGRAPAPGRRRGRRARRRVRGHGHAARTVR